MKNLFVPCEIALLAEEKGFDEECLMGYDSFNRLISKVSHTNNGAEISWDKHDIHLPAPMYQQLVDWFREKHGIEICASYGLGKSDPDDKDWNFHVMRMEPFKSMGIYGHKDYYVAYNEALTEALKPL